MGGPTPINYGAASLSAGRESCFSRRPAAKLSADLIWSSRPATCSDLRLAVLCVCVVVVAVVVVVVVVVAVVVVCLFYVVCVVYVLPAATRTDLSTLGVRGWWVGGVKHGGPEAWGKTKVVLAKVVS